MQSKLYNQWMHFQNIITVYKDYYVLNWCRIWIQNLHKTLNWMKQKCLAAWRQLVQIKSLAKASSVVISYSPMACLTCHRKKEGIIKEIEVWYGFATFKNAFSIKGVNGNSLVFVKGNLMLSQNERMTVINPCSTNFSSHVLPPNNLQF